MNHRIASNNSSLILAGVRSMGNAEVARLLNCSESTVSELAAEGQYKLNFHTVSELLARMNLKVVSADKVCVDPKKLEQVVDMAKEYMATITTEKLFEDEGL